MDAPEGRAGDPSPGSLGSVAATVLALVRTRVALVGVELREETGRAIGLLVSVAVAVLFLGAALVAFALFVGVVFWDTYRVPALAVVTVLYAAIGIVLLMRIRSALRTAPIPFEATLGELDRDLAAMRSSSPAGENP
jgi:uncharacterized membrane protein YqjE